MTEAQEVQTEVVEQAYELDGREVTRAEYIRNMFKNQDKSRGEIAKELNIPYAAVYSATANMENSHHTTGGGGIAAKKYVTLEDGTQMARADYIRKRAKEGATRGEIAKELQISYSAVWAATKDLEGIAGGTFGGAVMVTHPETGESVKRVDYIRELFTQGKTRREIANAVGCDYAVVWAATRQPKEVDEAAPVPEEALDFVPVDDDFPE